MAESEHKIRIIPLGGVDEFGKNITVVEYGEDMLVVDCGSIFPKEDMTDNAPTSGKYDLILGIRPEQISISRERTSPEQVEAHVYAGMPAGSETLVAVRVGEKLITVKELGSTHYGGDEVVYLSFDPKKINVFDAKSENLIKYCR